ncbi:plexin-B1-like isoform X2 [Mytilus californianus]|uniref:plexin-B1-like isoform X2 n=1 Tax=Mytilus californianus TaxID=6549 RepID=UPI002247B6FB|nr:plexin-B1-like isoform X2 [Mytilus californianus]
MGFQRKLSFSFILYIIAIALEGTLSQTSTETKISTLRQMIISNETIYVGGVGGIVSLHRENMTEKASDINYSNVWLLLYDKEKEEIIQCNENYDNVSHCSKLDVFLQNTGIERTDISVDLRYLPTYNMIYVNEVNTSIVVIGANSAEVLNTSYGILSFNLTNFTLSNTEQNRRGPMNIERADEENLTLAFKSSFYRAPHFYFFFQVHANNQFELSRIGKLCLQYKTYNERDGYNHSYEDMNIMCTYNGTTLTKIDYVLDGGEFAIFHFLHNNYSVICAHSWTDIEKDYKKSRKLQLLCRNISNSEKDGEYFEPDTYLGQRGQEHCFNNETYCDKGDVACGNLEGDICNITYHHTLVGGKGIENMDAIFDINKTITALAILQTNKYSVLYFGTIDGQLGMVYLNLGRKHESYRKPLLSIANSTIINIKVEKDGVYFITERKINKTDFEDCSIHKNCESCVDSFNSYCGWDYAENRCNIHNPNSTVWILSAEGFCIQFSNISHRIKINTEDNTNITFDILIPSGTIVNNREGNFRCRINETDAIGTVNNRMRNLCNINITRLHSDNYTFEITYEEVMIASSTIEFYKCQHFKKCKECTKRPACYWDPIFFSCGNPESNLTIAVDEEEKCPRLDNDVELHLYANRPENLTIRVREFEINLIEKMTSSNFTCEISQNGIIVTASGVLWGMNYTHFSCMGVQLIEIAEPYIVRLKYNDLYFDNEATLNVYTCGSFHNNKNCGKSQFVKNCHWNNSCCIDIRSGMCSQNKDTVTVKKIYPVSGPVKGGTSIIVSVNNEDDEPDYFFIDGAECTDITEEKDDKDDFTKPRSRVNATLEEEDSSFSCITGEVSEPNNGKINMSFKGRPSPIVKNTYFTYKVPGDIHDFHPMKGILAGNTTITITGQNITFEGPDRYTIDFCDRYNVICIECSIFDSVNMNDSKIMCKTGESNETRNLTQLVVVIDTLTTLRLNRTFQYLPDPTFDISNETLKAIESGGAKFTINGDGFKNVGQITVERVDEPCEVPSDKQAVCQTPEKLLNQPNVQTVIVNFDGIARTFEINYVDDPSFERFDGVVDYDKESPITIKGKNILNGAGIGDYNIQVGLDGKCLLESDSDITMNYIKCVPPKNVPRTNKSEVNTVHVIVGVGRIEVYIGDLQYQEDVNVLAIIVGVLAAALVTAVIIGIFAVVVLRKNKRKTIKEFKMELMTREELVRKTSREEFADAQMTMRSIKSELFTSKVPFCDYQTYVFRQLFPNQDITTNPLLHDLEVSHERKVGTKTAIDNFEILLSNKLFLKSLVQTLDRPNMLTIQEKAHFSSVLSISLMGNMRLFFDLIECLMVDRIRSATKKQHKVLFRRFESITLRLMANWLQIGLYGQLTSHCGMQLFMMYKAVKTIVEMAPIDALTSNSKNTIAEEKLLKMRIEHQSLTLQIDLNGNSDQRYPVKVLDCDTISQVKQKCCEQIYKNKPSLKIPHNDELSIEWQEGRAGKLTLNDIDNTSERNNGWVFLNTLKHYMVKDNSRMALIYKQHDDQNVNVNSTAFQEESLMSEDITLLMPENIECAELDGQKWHLETDLVSKSCILFIRWTKMLRIVSISNDVII